VATTSVPTCTKVHTSPDAHALGWRGVHACTGEQTGTVIIEVAVPRSQK
jgi:hypothetical protein